ncbi:MAG: M48 family metallopeptidase, partial [Proteobacteria bacterium]|nr:M48 family metallopeptidase [Pseudomonadota bacterium]
PIRLKLSGGAERLTLDGDAAFLLTQCPNLVLRRTATAGIGWRRWGIAGTLAALSVVGIFWLLIPAAAGWAVSLVPKQAEERLGLATRDQIVDLIGKIGNAGQPPVCIDSNANRLLARAADELATAMDSPFKIHLSVVRLDVVNAIALPGGQIVLLSSLIDKAANGDELAGVIAHEIAHVVRRDPLHVAVMRAGAAAMIGLVIGDFTGGVIASGLVSAAIKGGYNRDAERDADRLAVTALNALGRTARPFADFLSRVGADPADAAIPGFLSTHPSGSARADDIRTLSTGHGRTFSPHEWDAIRKLCR